MWWPSWAIWIIYIFSLSNDIWVQLGHIQVNLIRSAHNSIRFIKNLYYQDVLDTYPVYFGQMFLVFTPSGGLLQWKVVQATAGLMVDVWYSWSYWACSQAGQRYFSWLDFDPTDSGLFGSMLPSKYGYMRNSSIWSLTVLCARYWFWLHIWICNTDFNSVVHHFRFGNLLTKGEQVTSQGPSSTMPWSLWQLDKQGESCQQNWWRQHSQVLQLHKFHLHKSILLVPQQCMGR